MKRAAEDPEDAHKRLKRSHDFYTAGLSTVRFLSNKATWHTSKSLLATGRVHVSCIKECPSTSTLCIQGTVSAPSSSTERASVPSTCSSSIQTQVQLLLDTRSGELLDADTSCCRGGYHAARGSFCPCVGALLLAAAQLQSLQHGEHQEMAVHTWPGTDAMSQRQQGHEGAGQLHLLQQPGLVQQQPPELMQELARVSAPDGGSPQVKVVEVAEMQHMGYLAYRYQEAPSGDHIPSLIPARSGMLNNPNQRLLWSEDCSLPGHRQIPRDNGVRGGWGHRPVYRLNRVYSPEPPMHPGTAGQQDMDVSSNEEVRTASCKAQVVLAALGATHLTCYMGELVPGWHKRPKVINWAFSLLLSAANDAPPSLGNSNGSSSSSSCAPPRGVADGRALVALTGLLRVLWHTLHVTGITGLRDLLLVAMALRNLLLAMALPVWVNKAVAAQLRAWQEGISGAHAVQPLVTHDGVRVVHLLRVLEEAEQLCYHSWEHPLLQAAIQGPQAADGGPGSLCQQLQQLEQQLMPEEFEAPGLVLLRLAYLELRGDASGHTRLALACRQWDTVVGALLRSGDRSQLRLAAELLPRHISALPRRLDYMQQLLELEELGVVERLELAAHLLLSLRAGLHPVHQHPENAHGYDALAWWTVPVGLLHAWDPSLKDKAFERALWREQTSFEIHLGGFLRTFLGLATTVQFDLANSSVAAAAAASGRDPGASGAQDVDQGSASSPDTTTAALQEGHGRPAAAAGKTPVRSVLGSGGGGAAAAAASGPGPASAAAGQDPGASAQHKAALSPQASLATPLMRYEPPQGQGEPTDPIRMDRMLRQYWPLDPQGFVAKDVQEELTVQVEPFLLPDLLPLCGLAPAALHAVVERAMAPLFEAAFAQNDTCSRSNHHVRDALGPLLQLSEYPGVEHGDSAVRLQMALEMVAYFVALTPLSSGAGALSIVYKPLLLGLLYMGQQGLAWVVAKAAYRVSPDRFTATYLLLLGMQRGPEAQAAAVDWILGRDWPQAADVTTPPFPRYPYYDVYSPADSPTSSTSHQGDATTAGDAGSSIDTQQLLSSKATEASVLADTASSSKPKWCPTGAPQPQEPQLSPDELLARCMACLRGQDPGPGGPRDLPHLVESLQQVAGQGHLAQDSLGGLACCAGVAVHQEVLHRPHEGLSLLQTVAAWDALQPCKDASAGGGGICAGSIPCLWGVAEAAAAAAAEGRSSLEPALHLKALVWDMLRVSPSHDWRKRAVQLRAMALPAVVAFCASAGLQRDLVARLGLVLLATGPPSTMASFSAYAENDAIDWEGWFEMMAAERFMQNPVGHLPTAEGAPSDVDTGANPPRGHGITFGTCSIGGLRATGPGDDVDFKLQHPYGFGPWLLHFLQATAATPGHTTSAASSSQAAVAAAPAQATLLRQLWRLHEGRCYHPWMLWLATALLRAGEEQLACEVAAQGLLPSACTFWCISSFKYSDQSCLAELLPLLAASEKQDVQQGLAATQLLLRQPLAPNLLLQPGVLQSLLQLWKRVGDCYLDDGMEAEGRGVYGCVVLSSSWSMVDGSLQEKDSVESPKLKMTAALHTLITDNIMAPLASSLPASTAGGQLQLAAQPSPQEEELVSLLSAAMAGAGLLWREQLYLCRCARQAGIIRSWPSMVSLLNTPLLDGALAHHAAVAAAWHGEAPGTLQEWEQTGVAVVCRWLQEVDTWVCGCVAWLVTELDKAGDAGVPIEQLEQLSSSLSPVCSSHMLLYAAAAARATGGSLAQGSLCQLMCNGALPRAAWTMGSWEIASWDRLQYLRELRLLLQCGELLAALPASTVKDVAVTYAMRSGTMRDVLAANQLLYAVDQHHSNAAAAAVDDQSSRTEVVLCLGAAGCAVPTVPDSAASVNEEGRVTITAHPELYPLLRRQAVPVEKALEHFTSVQEHAASFNMPGVLRTLWGVDIKPQQPAKAAKPEYSADLEDSLQLLEPLFDLLDHAACLGAPAITWLEQDNNYSSSRELLRGPLGRPTTEMDALLSGVAHPLLQLKVLQVLIWQLSKAVLTAAPGYRLRRCKGPAAPWRHKATAAEPCAAVASYAACSNSWEELPASELAALYAAACQAMHPAGQAQQRGAAANIVDQAAAVAGWLEAQEVALAWALVKYAERRCNMPAVLRHVPELTSHITLEIDTCHTQLGQLPVFMTQLGAAVKQQRERYPLYALFRRAFVEYDVYQFVWQPHPAPSQQQLEGYLNRKFNRVAVQQLCVEALPWLGWVGADKAAEVSLLARWLRWLAVDQRGVLGMEVQSDLEDPFPEGPAPPAREWGGPFANPAADFEADFEEEVLIEEEEEEWDLLDAMGPAEWFIEPDGDIAEPDSDAMDL